MKKVSSSFDNHQNGSNPLNLKEYNNKIFNRLDSKSHLKKQVLLLVKMMHDLMITAIWPEAQKMCFH